jgi:hypothetical protein
MSRDAAGRSLPGILIAFAFVIFIVNSENAWNWFGRHMSSLEFLFRKRNTFRDALSHMPFNFEAAEAHLTRHILRHRRTAQECPSPLVSALDER